MVLEMPIVEVLNLLLDFTKLILGLGCYVSAVLFMVVAVLFQDG